MSYIDHLREHMQGEVNCYFKGASHLPMEFNEFPQEKIIGWLTDEATGILRGSVQNALDASISSLCFMIRFGRNGNKT